jgi:hypothetical protein
VSDPKEILLALQTADARFVIVGGFAMIAHGSSYITEDLDLVYARDERNLSAIVKALGPLDPRLRIAGEPAGLPFLFDTKTLQNGLNFTLTTSSGDVDLLGVIAGIGGYDDVNATAENMSIAGHVFRILSLSGIIRSKRAAGRPKDKLALPELEHLLEIKRVGEEDT